MEEKAYEINDATLAIIPEKKKGSLILEEEFQYENSKNPLELINYSCKYFGSTYEGRRDGAKEILLSKYKLPIMIEDSRNLIFLPTESPESNDCAWLALNKIKNVEKIDNEKDKTIVEFHNGPRLVLNISYNSMQNQILRASRLDSILRNRKNREKL